MIQEHTYAHSDSAASMLTMLVSMVDNAIFMLDAQQHIVVCNPVAQGLYAVTAQEVLGHHYSVVYTIDQLTSTYDAQSVDAQLHATGGWRGVQQHRTRDGRILTVDVTMQLLPDNMYAAQTLLLMRDLSEQHAHESVADQADQPRVLSIQRPLQQELEPVAQPDDQLQYSVEQLQLALTALDGFIYDYDIQQDRVEYSAGLIRLLGYHRDTISARAAWWISLVHPKDRAGLPFAHKLNQDAQHSYSNEYRVRHKHGYYIHVWDRAIVIRDAQGQPQRLIGATINITERKQAEERQRYLTNISKILADSLEYEARLNDIVRLTVLSIADWCVIDLLNEHDRLVTAALAHSNTHKEHVLQELCLHYPIHRTALAQTALILKTGASQWYPVVTEALLQSELSPRELQLWTTLGYSSLIIVPLVRQKKVIGIFTLVLGNAERRYVQDDRSLAELAAWRITIAIENSRLFRSERIARAVAEQAVDRSAFLNEIGSLLSTSLSDSERLNNFVRFTVPRFCDLCLIFLSGPDGSIYCAAAAHVDAAKEAQLLQTQELEPIDPQGPHPAAAVMRKCQTMINPDLTAFLGQEADSQTGDRGSASLLPQDLVIVPLVIRQHGLGAIAFGIDLSNRKLSLEDVATAETLANRVALMIDNAQLYRNQQEAINVRDVFLLTASHELKTPLTAILGQAQLLQQRLKPSNPVSERDTRTIRVIVEQARRLNKLIHTLLDVSRLSQGQLQIVREPVQLNILVRRAVDDFQLLLVQHTVNYEETTQQLVVQGDLLRLEQVLQNLLQNALKYSPQGGTISVKLQARGTQALITISDRGIGIPQEALPRLFQRFYRVNNAAAQDMSGIGVGLYVVREIVTLHGGSIYVESREGQGSSFMISLPLARTEALPEPAAT